MDGSLCVTHSKFSKAKFENEFEIKPSACGTTSVGRVLCIERYSGTGGRATTDTASVPPRCVCGERARFHSGFSFSKFVSRTTRCTSIDWDPSHGLHVADCARTAVITHLKSAKSYH
eukprot:1679985-Prymnesium_polylepis.1